MKKHKIAYVTGSRADYGIVRQYLHLLNKDDAIDFSLLVTGSHLEKKFGYSIDVIKADGFKIEAEIPLHIENEENIGILHSMSIALDEFGRYFEKTKYDLLIILGDRYEMLAVSIAASIQKIPILHLHGGEITYGNYDEFIRHCITKMSLYHITSTEVYRSRVIQMGEEPERVFYLGALGAENCGNIDMSKVPDEMKKLTGQKYWVVAFHPETMTSSDLEQQVHEVLNAISKMNEYKFIFMGTNADTKSDRIRDAWRTYVEENENVLYYENLNSDAFLYLVKNAIALIGNSSSGIIEAPSLGVYTINIGSRQAGRVHGESVVDVNCNSKDILQAMKTIEKLRIEKNSFDNPYYRENTAINYYSTTKQILEIPTDMPKVFYDLESKRGDEIL